MAHKETVLISVGGSLIAPEKPDPAFLKNFSAFIRKKVARGMRFILIAGGGKTARNYQEGLRLTKKVSQKDVDWVGIHATRLNAELLRLIFGELSHDVIVSNPTLRVDAQRPVIIACGWKPGRSTDYGAILLAKNFGIRRVINLSNIDYVYTSDPRINRSATPIRRITWKKFRALLPKRWAPGLSSPFDPVAARQAEKMGIEVAIINGKHFREIEKYLAGKKFVGSVITQN